MRSGLVEAGELDQKDYAMWRGRVASSIRGRRGQQLLRDALAALDAMPAKRLIPEAIVEDGDVCLLGAVANARGMPAVNLLDPEDHDDLSKKFNVAACLIREIEYVNDEEGRAEETPEERFIRVRKWIERHIAAGV